MICLVLTKEMTNSKEIHAELTECLLHLLSDKMPLIIDSNDYFVMKEMFLKIRPCLIGQRTNLTRLLARLQRSGNSVSQKIIFIFLFSNKCLLHFLSQQHEI